MKIKSIERQPIVGDYEAWRFVVSHDAGEIAKTLYLGGVGRKVFADHKGQWRYDVAKFMRELERDVAVQERGDSWREGFVSSADSDLVTQALERIAEAV